MTIDLGEVDFERTQGERWRVAPKTKGHYAVSSHGRVVRLVGGGHGTRPGRILKPVPNGKRAGGYLTVNLCIEGESTTHNLHTLVAEAFIGPRPDGYEIHHRDHEVTNCRLDNLAVIPHEDNERDVRR